MPPFNGNGVFSRQYSWQNDAANSIPITASRMDGDSNDFASGLSLAVTRDGQGVPTADIPWGGHKITNLANGTASTDAMAYGQFINSMLSCRNKIRNGTMDIAQRGTSFAGAGSGGFYTLDGWYKYSAGSQVVTISQQPNSNTSSEFQSVLRVVVTTANASPAIGDQFLITQPIEGYLVRDLIGNPIAIQFTVKSPKAGTHCVSINNSGNDRSYVMTYNVAAANVQQTVTLTIPSGLITAGTWNWTTGVGLKLNFCLMAGSFYVTAAPNQWLTNTFYCTSAQVNCMDTIGNTFEITGVQLERNSVSTPFEHLDYALELVRNQRYYQIIDASVRSNATAAGQLFSVGVSIQSMRVAPTAGAFTGTEATGNATSVGLQTTTPYGVRFQITSVAAGDCYALSYIYPLSAEL